MHGCPAEVQCAEHPRIFRERNSADAPGRFKKACDPDVRMRNIRGLPDTEHPWIFRARNSADVPGRCKKACDPDVRMRNIHGLPDTDHSRTSARETSGDFRMRNICGLPGPEHPRSSAAFSVGKPCFKTWELGNNPY